MFSSKASGGLFSSKRGFFTVHFLQKTKTVKTDLLRDFAYPYIAATKVSCRSRRSGGGATQDGVIVLPTKTGAEEYSHAFKYITLNN